MKKSRALFELFIALFKIGLFTFGGGYAMIALLENEFVVKKEWLTKDEFLDLVAIAESTPGPIAINAATYIGYKRSALIGALLATAAICTPSFIIIYIISLFLDTFLSMTLVASAFRGIQICVIYLILSAGLKMIREMKKTPFNVVIAITVIVCMITLSLFAINFSSVFYILICGALGLCGRLICKIRRKEGKK